MPTRTAMTVATGITLAALALLVHGQATQPAKPQGDAPQGQKTTTPGGVTVVTTRAGEGARHGDAVFVHYIGRLTDGTQFDASHDRGEPISFLLGAGQVIVGWEEGLQGMQVGEKRTLTIPPNLAYGAEGRPPRIPPNATLVFEIELLGLQRK